MRPELFYNCEELSSSSVLSGQVWLVGLGLMHDRLAGPVHGMNLVHGNRADLV